MRSVSTTAGSWRRCRSVRISGEVQRPGTYRLLQNMTNVICSVNAGNPRQTAYLNSADLTRTPPRTGTVKTIPISVHLAKAIAADPQYNLLLQNFDDLLCIKYRAGPRKQVAI